MTVTFINNNNIKTNGTSFLSSVSEQNISYLKVSNGVVCILYGRIQLSLAVERIVRKNPEALLAKPASVLEPK